MTRPNPHIALIYHYDLARALAGEVVDWQAIPVDVDAGREGGDLCRAAADFAKRRDLFAMPAPAPDPLGDLERRAWELKSAVPVDPNPAVEQQAADPEPSMASTTVPGPAVTSGSYSDGDKAPANFDLILAGNRSRLRDRIKGLVDQGHEALIRRHWPESVPTLKHDGHSDAQLQLILAAVRRVEAEVGAGWHPDDGPPPHVNTNPRASVEYPAAAVPDEGGMSDGSHVDEMLITFNMLSSDQKALCAQLAAEAAEAGRSISVSAFPSVRRWSIARAVIAWAASGRTIDELWFAASNLATFEQCRDPSATLGGLISQFTIEQADRLYDAAQAATHIK